MISTGSFGLTNLSLERCKVVPLTLHLDTRKFRGDPQFSHLITPYIQNTETLFSSTTFQPLKNSNPLKNYPLRLQRGTRRCSFRGLSYLFNLNLPTSIEYCPYKRRIKLSGPNGSFSLNRSPGQADGGGPYTEFSLLPPEIFSIECEAGISYLLSHLFLNPSSYSSSKTLAFLDRDPDDGFMKILRRFSYIRKNTTSAWLHRVVIVSSKEIFSSVAWTDMLAKHVPVVKIRAGKELPPDLKLR